MSIYLNYWNELFEEPKTELTYSNNFELLIAVILSAQCTDKKVNEITSKLFKKYNTPQQFANLEQQKLEKEIYSSGFFRNKAKNIIKASQDIVNKFNGKVPNTMEDLKKLAGVGQKTASVIYSAGFGGDAFAVDTHVFRVSNRLGISSSKNVKQCEADLKKYFKKPLWNKVHHQMVLFGRYYCKARSPQCNTCKLKDVCQYYKNNNKKTSI
ncbi:MAG: endonuclease III [Clostridia bacterium]|nr:endonuclease III [Clostridia bacterium]